MRARHGVIRAAWLAVAACMLLDAVPSFAQPKANYRELVRKALDAFGHEHWAEARGFFLSAHQLDPNARTLRGLGMVAFEMEDFVAAYRLLGESLAEPRHALDGNLRKDTEALLQRTRLLIGRVRLTLDPPSARVTLDSEPIDPRRDQWLTIGRHVLVAEAEGYEAKRLMLDIGNGDDQSLELQLDPVQLAAPQAVAADQIAAERVTRSIDHSPSPAPGEQSSIVNRWWFWAAAGSVVAAGTIVAIAASSSGGPTTKPLVQGTAGGVLTTE